MIEEVALGWMLTMSILYGYVWMIRSLAGVRS